jgi:hypothetical protein
MLVAAKLYKVETFVNRNKGKLSVNQLFSSLVSDMISTVGRNLQRQLCLQWPNWPVSQLYRQGPQPCQTFVVLNRFLSAAGDEASGDQKHNKLASENSSNAQLEKVPVHCFKK